MIPRFTSKSFHKIRLAAIFVLTSMAVQLPASEYQQAAFRVEAKGGLNIRDGASPEAKKIVTVPNGQTVMVTEERAEIIQIGTVKGKWVKIQWQEYVGWAFNGFLRPISLASQKQLKAGNDSQIQKEILSLINSKASNDSDHSQESKEQLEKFTGIFQKAGNLDFRDKKGRTPLMLAAMKKKKINIIAALITAKADINAQCALGNTALMYALKSDFYNAYPLLDAKADCTLKNRAGETAATLAQKIDFNEAVGEVQERIQKAGCK